MPNAAIRSGKEDRDNDTDLELKTKECCKLSLVR